MNKTVLKRTILWTLAILLALFYLIISIVPFIYMLLNSFKGKFEMLSKGIFAMPDSFAFTNFHVVISNGFFKFFGNSVFVLVISLAILLFITACASYPLARFKFRFSTPVYSIIIACMSIPVHITLIPIFKMSNLFGAYDTVWGLIGPYVSFGLPISIFILTTFMKSIPKEIEESAEIDGCNKYRIFFQIILPLIKPGLSTLAIYNGVNIWNEFVFAYTLTQTRASRTLPLAVWEFQGEYAMNIPMIMTVLTLSILPMILLFAIFQEKLVKGMTAGAVKG